MSFTITNQKELVINFRGRALLVAYRPMTARESMIRMGKASELAGLSQPDMEAKIHRGDLSVIEEVIELGVTECVLRVIDIRDMGPAPEFAEGVEPGASVKFTLTDETSGTWRSLDDQAKREILMSYYQDFTRVIFEGMQSRADRRGQGFLA